MDRRIFALIAVLVAMPMLSVGLPPSPYGYSPNVSPVLQETPTPGFALTTQSNSVPTRAQVRSAAWSLQSQIDAAAGRKTSNASDGTGGSQVPPTEITVSTEWVNKYASITNPLGVYINLTDGSAPPATVVLNFWMNNSFIEGNNASKLFRPTFVRPSAYGTNYPYTINIYVTNSTIRDFGNLTWPTAVNMGGYNTGNHMNIWFDNATVINARTTATNLGYSAGTNCDIQIHQCDNFVKDSTFSHFNYAPGWDNWALINQNDAGHPDMGYVYRSRFIDNNIERDGAAGSVISYVPQVKWNYFQEVGFNGIVELSRDFSALGGGEKVNYSYNYFTMTPQVEFGHKTSIGIGGSSWNPGDYFQKPMFGSNQWASVYRNYVNNSRYIQYQTYGNASNIYFTNNYYANGGPTFSEAWGLNWRSHNITLDGNYIFDDISTGYYTNGACCSGIVVTGFAYNITVRNNVLYDIGVYAFWVTGMGLKFKNGTGIERSDYSYRAMQNTFTGNHVDGINYYALAQDSGYTAWYNNTFTNLLAQPGGGGGQGRYLYISDGWSPSGMGTQIDWHGGTDFSAQTANLNFAPPVADRQALVWFRTFEGGTFQATASNPTYPAHVIDNTSSGFWGNTYDCIQEQTPATAVYWTGLPCDSMQDAENFTLANGATHWSWRPVDYWNYTRAFSGPAVMSDNWKVDYAIPGGKTVTVTDLTTGNQSSYYIGSINVPIDAGDSYRITEADAGTARYLVGDDAACSSSAVGTDPDCWSASSGGAGGAGIPDATTPVTIDSSSGSGPSLGGTPLVAASLTATGTGHLSLGGATIYINGSVVIGSVAAYLDLGSTSMTVNGTWTSMSASSGWNAGTSTVRIKPNGNATMTPGAPTGNEFYDIVFDDTSAWSGRSVITTAANRLKVARDLTIQDTSGGYTFLVIATNPAATVGRDYIMNSGAVSNEYGLLTIGRNWNSANGEHYAQQGASTVEFAGSGDLTVNPTNGAHVHFYNVVVDAGVTVTSQTSGVEIYNQLTVNGTLRTPDTVTGPFAWKSVVVVGIDTQYPLVLGPSGDVSGVADFRYLTIDRGGGSPITTHYIAAGTYHYLDIPATNTGTTIRLAGNIRTQCSATAQPNTFNKCAMLIAGWTANQWFSFRTDNYRMDIEGMLWIGDVGNRSANFYAGSSTITAGGIQVKESSKVFWGSATVVSTELFGQGSQPGYSHQGQVYSYAQDATFDIHGDFYFYNATTESPSYAETGLYANNSRWVVDGWFVVRGWKSFVNFGASTWTIGQSVNAAAAGSLPYEGWWYSESRDSRWDAGTSTVTIQADRDGRFNPAGTRLPVPEFRNLVIESNNATRTYLMNTWGSNTLGLWTHNLTVRGGGGQAALDMNGKTVRIDGTLRLETGGSVNNIGASLATSTADYAGGTATADIAAKTLIYEGTMFNTMVPTGVTFAGTAGEIGSVAWVNFTNQNITWRFNPAVPGDTVTITVTGLSPGFRYRLLRDNASIALDSDMGSSVTFVVVGGWSEHQMTIEQVQNGGGSGPPPQQPVLTPPTPTFDLNAAVIMLMFLIAALVVAAFVNKR